MRLLNLPDVISQTPITDIPAGTNWFSPAPANAAAMSMFSGLAFYFGRDLYQTENIPIGLIEAAYGGQSCEQFVSLQGLQDEPAMANALGHPYSGSSSAFWPTGIFNGMIYAVTPYTICAVAWDQGETNAGNLGSGTGPYIQSADYKTLIATLIRDWRMWWNTNLPFFVVQLQNLTTYNSCTDLTEPAWADDSQPLQNSPWGDVRWGQFDCLKMPFTGMSINFWDNPNAYNCNAAYAYHPPNKEDFAARLVPWMQRVVYGQTSTPLTQTGPLYDHYQINGSQITCYFTFPNGTPGLSTNNAQPVTCFEIAPVGTTNYVWATATISGNTVVVSSPSVPSPGSVRYAWNYNPVDPVGPIANLSDTQGYLASPFQTYDFSNIFVMGKGVTIQDMNLTPLTTDGTDFGNVGLTQPVTETFTIQNDSAAGAPLTLTGGANNYIRFLGTNASDYSVVTQPSQTVLSPGSSTTFQVQFLPGAMGLRTAILQIPSNTSTKTPYTIYIQGTGVNNFTATPTPTGT
jgi:hypothetical protein